MAFEKLFLIKETKIENAFYNMYETSCKDLISNNDKNINNLLLLKLFPFFCPS